MAPSTTKMMALLAVLALAGPAVTQARRLRGNGHNWGDSGDPTGTQVLSMARSFEGAKGTVKRAVTPEAAEASANSQFAALFRNQIVKGSSVAFAMTPATVENDPAFTGGNSKQVVKTRARSAIDTPRPAADLESGSAMMPTMAMGGVSAAQTFEGATSIAASDSVMVNGGGKRPGPKHTDASHSMLTSYTHGVPRASKAGSFGTTAQTAMSAAYAGPGDGKITIAQANEVSSISQASQSNYDQWQTSPSGKQIDSAAIAFERTDGAKTH